MLLYFLTNYITFLVDVGEYKALKECFTVKSINIKLFLLTGQLWQFKLKKNNNFYYLFLE